VRFAVRHGRPAGRSARPRVCRRRLRSGSAWTRIVRTAVPTALTAAASAASSWSRSARPTGLTRASGAASRQQVTARAAASPVLSPQRPNGRRHRATPPAHRIGQRGIGQRPPRRHQFDQTVDRFTAQPLVVPPGGKDRPVGKCHQSRPAGQGEVHPALRGWLRHPQCLLSITIWRCRDYPECWSTLVICSERQVASPISAGQSVLSQVSRSCQMALRAKLHRCVCRSTDPERSHKIKHWQWPAGGAGFGRPDVSGPTGPALTRTPIRDVIRRLRCCDGRRQTGPVRRTHAR
jgi:hypothetical protein